MTDQVSIQLPESLYQRMEQLSRRLDQPVEKVLADALTLFEQQAVLDGKNRKMMREQGTEVRVYRGA